MADAEAEQLQQLPGIVLIRLAFDIAVGVQPDQHSGIATDVEQERPEMTQRVPPQQLLLVEHQRRHCHLVDTGGEVIVPEQRHFLAQRIGTVERAIQPPGAQLIGLGQLRHLALEGGRETFPLCSLRAPLEQP